MIDLLIKIVAAIGAIGAVLAVCVAGFFYVAGLLKKGKNTEDDRLITLLQTTVTELDKKVTSQKEEHTLEINTLTKKIAELSTKLGELDKENKTLVTILQGRDDRTLQFQTDVMKAIAQGAQTHELCRSTNESLARLCTLMEQSMKAA